MGGLFSKPKAPAPDPAIAKAKKAEKKRIAQEKALLAEESAARRRGLRGQRSLLSGGYTGFQDDEDDKKTTLGG